MKYAVKVHVEDSAPVFRPDLHEGVRQANPSVVNQDIESVPYRIDIFKGRGNRIDVGDVSDDRGGE